MSVPIRRLDDLAETCVFSKQSPEPFLCDPVRLLPQGIHLIRAPLLPKLRGHFAEFLNEGSLEHLRILSPSTCVGLRYGHQRAHIEVFLGSMITVSLRPYGLPIASRS